MMKDRNLGKGEGNLRFYNDGEVVFEEGSDGKEVYFIVDGKAEISQQIDERQNHVPTILGKGDFFGEMAALNSEARSMTVIARGELQVYELTLDEMLSYMRSNPEIMRDVFSSLARRLQDTNLKVKQLASRTYTGSEYEDDWTEYTSYIDKPSILVVDDHPNIRESLKRLFGDEYSVITTPDGASALHIMRLHEIGIVLAGYRMPEMSGTELMENIKSMYPDAVRIIICGHNDQNALIGAAAESLIHEVIVKPWRDEEFKLIIARWAEQYRKTMWLARQTEQEAVLQKQLKESNALIEQLIQELKEKSTPEHHENPWYRKFSRKNRKDEKELRAEK